MDVNNVGNQTYYANTASTANDSMGKDTFFKILIAQLQNQDPLSPQDDKEFIAQMAQINATEKMNEVAETTRMTQAYSMIGKNIYAEVVSTQGSLPFAGKVDAVTRYNGAHYYRIGTDNVPIESLKRVYADDGAQGEILEASSMLGNYVLVTVSTPTERTDENGNTTIVNVTSTVTGAVEEAYERDGAAYLVINGTEVKYSYIKGITYFADVEGIKETYKEMTE